ncbi:IS66-like element ISRm14 family transposase [Sinorhizobium meliloti]|uniref:Transposase n=5 Tax=Rhizobium meliloti TaxID=382 RepID=Q92VN5_RHIME|nr:IS66-like element ISRm14 family transposase [Sinorhizobium meliloti]AGG71680.1 Putative transposase [Sinorhizobium meliloti 2011]ASP62229.1 IS66 family transposase [Sinorhizobium meliloti]MCK3804882.1 IS66-like element ISRm14 family transposase [Sinorhizobium meliloti]MCK3810889.1 IS66-like element ISRm14 family transposase [Sinorhizobium meliloti]MCK3815927.1 IS66-like element ISRm14 family transposase [Sinorhizobium meliloti]
MSSPLDLSLFPNLPPEVVKAFAAMQFELSVERAARQHEQAVVAEKDAFIAELKELVEKLEGQVHDYRRTKFGPKSEKLDPAQMELALEDLETAIAETQARIAAVEKKIEASASDPEKVAPRKERKARALPEHLPRVERVIEPESIVCPCGCGNMVRIGEDRTERLDRVPARYEVIVTIRPKYACPKGRTGVVQARAPAHLLEGSWPTEALLAEIAVSKHSEHMPLNRQAEVMARHGVPIDRTVLADWMGRTGAAIAPVVDHMAKRLLWESTRLYVDETTAPVLDPGRGKTKTGYLWAVLRDDRGWNGSAPPGVVFHYRPGRKGEYAAEILDGFNGTIQVDAYGGYSHLATLDRVGGDPLKLAFCWAHGRRKLIKATPKSGSPIVDEALVRIAALYKIEDSIRGSDPEHRRAVRQDLSLPLVGAFFAWLAAQAKRVSRKSDLGKALAYMLTRQDGFRLFLDDGHVDIDSNLVENAIRRPAMNRRNALFAGHDEGGRNWARFASLIGTCKMNGVEPYAYLCDLFTRLANGHLAKDIDALMPWAYAARITASQ